MKVVRFIGKLGLIASALICAASARADRLQLKGVKPKAGVVRELRWEPRWLKHVGTRIIRQPPTGMKLDPRGRVVVHLSHGPGLRDQSRLGLNRISFQQLSQLPTGTLLHDVHGNERVVGIDHIDTHGKQGWLDVGFFDDMLGLVRFEDYHLRRANK